MRSIQLIEKYFSDLSPLQKVQFAQLQPVYTFWNEQINVVSRKDIDLLYERHILHSLAIAKFIQFEPSTRILDVGTGGGFPGIPLAILFPECTFHLVDSIAKKIKVVNEVAAALKLTNISAEQIRVEEIKESFDFIISRAVKAFPEFYGWVRNRIGKQSKNHLRNGIICLKGGDLSDELKGFAKVHIVELSHYFEEPFFETKKIVYFQG